MVYSQKFQSLKEQWLPGFLICYISLYCETISAVTSHPPTRNIYNLYLFVWFAFLLVKMIPSTQEFYSITWSLNSQRKVAFPSWHIQDCSFPISASHHSSHHLYLNPYRIENLELHLQTVSWWRSDLRHTRWPSSINRTLLHFCTASGFQMRELTKHLHHAAHRYRATLKITRWGQLAAHTGGCKSLTRSR